MSNMLKTFYTWAGLPAVNRIEELKTLLRRYPERTSGYYDDQQGILGTALLGVTTWTPAQYRNTGIVLNNITQGDVFSMLFQFTHRKKLETNIESVHLHNIPNISKDGNIAFDYSWGWYNTGDTIPDVLPNTGKTADIELLTTDQYKLKVINIVRDLIPTPVESYSSFLLVKCTAAAPTAGTNWWTTGNTLAIMYMDAHFYTDRFGSRYERAD